MKAPTLVKIITYFFSISFFVLLILPTPKTETQQIIRVIQISTNFIVMMIWNVGWMLLQELNKK